MSSANLYGTVAQVALLDPAFAPKAQLYGVVAQVAVTDVTPPGGGAAITWTGRTRARSFTGKWRKK